MPPCHPSVYGPAVITEHGKMGRCDNVMHDVNNKCDYITKSKEEGGGEKDNMCIG